MLKRFAFDIETDNLLVHCTRMWVMCLDDLDTGKEYTFREGNTQWMEMLDNATLAVGHNILGFDVYAIKKLFGYVFKPTCKLHDTLILSQVLNYRRFGHDGHSLERWGEHLGFPKGSYSDWSQYTPEMEEYCIQDTRIAAKVYRELMEEFAKRRENAPNLDKYIKAEHAASRWCSEAQLHGWPFDLEEAKKLSVMLETEMDKAYAALNEKLGTKCVPVDMVKGVVEVKKPKWTKAGFYDAHTARWFGVDPCSGYEGEERKIAGDYCRVEFKPLSLDSVADVKIFLNRNGWVPTDWNFKTDPDTGKKVKSSPKITEDSLEFLGGDGKLYLDFLTAKSRHAIIKTWITNTDSEGNLHGECMVIGTPSMRARHSIIVNVPSVDSPYGKEMRSLFRCKPGWALIGCDSSGNQARGLAHYLNDQGFIDTLLNGDIHQYNADILTEVVRSILRDHGFVVKRAQAKRILYAFLFGASGAKLWSYIFGNLDEANGKKLKEGFLAAVPGFKNLLDKLNSIFTKTSKIEDFGYIPSIAGNRVYVDSRHKLLVYLLQSAEKITCAAALMVTMQRLEEENIPYIPCIFYHDEIDFQVPEEYKERAAEIGKQAFADGPKLFGIQIMSGDAKIGKTWYDVH